MSQQETWNCAPLAQILGQHPLHIIDVGAAGGIDPVWRPIIGAGYGLGYGFEPFPQNFRKLIATDKIKYFPYAISDSVGTADFFGSTTVGSLTRRVEREQRYSEKYEIIKVRTETLQNLMKESVISGIDVLKIDVEGGEDAVLSGTGAHLDNVLYLKVEFSFDRSKGNAFHLIDAKAAEHKLRLFEFAVNYTGFEALSGGDVLYLRDIRTVLLEKRDKDEQRIRVAKLIAISLINNYRRYAYACARAAIEGRIFDAGEGQQLVDFITRPVFVPAVIGEFPGKHAINRLLFTCAQLFSGGGTKKTAPRENRLQKSPRLWFGGGFLPFLFKRKIENFWQGIYDNLKWN